MKRKVFITILSLTFLGLNFGALHAQTWNIGSPNAADVTATLSNDTLTISGTGDMQDYNDNSNRPPWYAQRASITTLAIEDGVASIGNHAFRNFSGCTDNLTIPNSVTTIGNYAFYACYNFTGNLTIPNSITSIGVVAFGGCSGFTGNLTIPNSVTSISVAAFASCSGLTSVSVSGTNFKLANNVGTAQVLIPYTDNGLNSSCSNVVGSLAFGNLTIPNTVTSIGYLAFLDCSGLTGNLTIPNGVTSIGELAFAYCSSLTGNLTIPNGVTSIGNAAFAACTGFNGNLTIPNSVDSIGNHAFNGCSGFTGNLTIPASLTSIGLGAFWDCSGFTGNLTIPNSVDSIGNNAFNGCSGLASIRVRATTPPRTASNAFYNVSTSIPVHVPCGKKNDYETASSWSNFTNIIEDVAAEDLIVQSSDMNMGIANIVQYNTCSNQTAIISATANLGYHFVKWNDGDTVNQRTITVTKDTTFTAEFAADGTGIAETWHTSSLQIYPNPVFDQLRITKRNSTVVNYETQFDGSQLKEGERVEIYNIQGGLVGVYRLEDETTIIDVSNLSAGVYFVRITTDKGVIVKKAVKN